MTEPLYIDYFSVTDCRCSVVEITEPIRKHQIAWRYPIEAKYKIETQADDRHWRVKIYLGINRDGLMPGYCIHLAATADFHTTGSTALYPTWGDYIRNYLSVEQSFMRTADFIQQLTAQYPYGIFRPSRIDMSRLFRDRQCLVKKLIR